VARGPRVEAGYRWPQVSIHRGTLFMLLLEAARERSAAPSAGVRAASCRSRRRAGHCCASRDGGGAGRRGMVARGRIHARSARPGIREGPPRWTGASCGGPSRSTRGPERAGRWCRPGQQTRSSSATPSRGRGGARPRSGQLDRGAAGGPATPVGAGGLNRPGRVEDFLPLFEGWDWPWLSVPSLIRAGAAVWEFPMVDRDPLPLDAGTGVRFWVTRRTRCIPIGSNGRRRASSTPGRSPSTSRRPARPSRASRPTRRPGGPRPLRSSPATRGAGAGSRAGPCGGAGPGGVRRGGAGRSPAAGRAGGDRSGLQAHGRVRSGGAERRRSLSARCGDYGACRAARVRAGQGRAWSRPACGRARSAAACRGATTSPAALLPSRRRPGSRGPRRSSSKPPSSTSIDEAASPSTPHRDAEGGDGLRGVSGWLR
jgi:hypothetical protein